MTLSIIIVFVLAALSMMVWGLGSILVPGFSTRKMGFMLLLGGLIIVVNTSLYVRDHYWEEELPDTAALEEESVNRAALLRQPESVCRLLVDHGFAPEIQSQTGKIWGKASPMYYSCEAHKSILDREPPMRLTYRVQSDDGQQVDLVRLQVEVPAVGSEQVVLEEFKRLSGRIFERLPTPVPDGFYTAIDDRIFRQFNQERGTVELLRDRLEEGYRLRMEIRPDPRRP